ncbi:MAG: S41 family peptidase [Planctomycetes bacterium]|nr:S41 family peptidase [Planctomycetota bacterium]
MTPLCRLLRVHLVLATLALTVAAGAQKQLAEGPSISPFRGMRLVGDDIEVQIDEATWYALEQVAGVESATLVRESKRICGQQWWKRITEDLPALLATMGTDTDGSVDLVVRDLATGERRDFPAVEMTHDKRQALREVHRGDPERARAGGETPDRLPMPAVREDLATLQRLLDERFAYRRLRDVDLDKLVRDAALRLAASGEAVPALALAREVDAILRAFGDGHSGLLEPLPLEHAGQLPFLIQQVAGGPVAFHGDRSGFVDPERPFVVAIDGVPIGDWLEAARARGVQGGAMMQQKAAERGLRDIAELRAALGLPVDGDVRVTLRADDAGDERDVALPLGRRRLTYGGWPRVSTVLRVKKIGDVGYLRIGSMQLEPEDLEALDEALQSVRATTALVIDVRGNGGGKRDALLRLLPYFLAPDGSPVVTNVAAARLQPGQQTRGDLLADRGLHPADWDGYDAAQRAAIGAFLKGFTPSWRLPAREFSPYCFLVQRHADNGNAFFYDKPVAVLIDRACFSATDVFAAALGALPRVTLVGEPTGGGSGRALPYQLPKSGVRLKLSSMASFRPDGVLFEGAGVVPDVAVETVPTDLIGTTDTVLQRALELLR